MIERCRIAHASLSVTNTLFAWADIRRAVARSLVDTYMAALTLADDAEGGDKDDKGGGTDPSGGQGSGGGAASRTPGNKRGGGGGGGSGDGGGGGQVKKPRGGGPGASGGTQRSVVADAVPMSYAAAAKPEVVDPFSIRRLLFAEQPPARPR